MFRFSGSQTIGVATMLLLVASVASAAVTGTRNPDGSTTFTGTVNAPAGTTTITAIGVRGQIYPCNPPIPVGPNGAFTSSGTFEPQVRVGFYYMTFYFSPSGSHTLPVTIN